MYKENRQFHTPDLQTVAWRYINFEKFVDLLTSKQLFFCRSDKFDDPFEGIFQLKDYEKTREMFSNMPKTKKFYFINSWHINDNQSDAMWKIFSKTNNGIAIKSSVEKIIASLVNTSEDVHIGRIYYRDYDKITFSDLADEPQNQISDRGSSTNQFNYKRISFEHEKELRLYHIDIPIPHSIKNGVEREPLEFKKINIDLSKLVDEIVIAPFADAWFKELVFRVSEKLNYKFTITTSTLYELRE